MARLREFDADEVMEAVINALWERGYEATSLADLVAVTGLQKGSLYKAFGDKAIAVPQSAPGLPGSAVQLNPLCRITKCIFIGKH